MGLLSALNSSVMAMIAQSNALSNVSGNIANSQSLSYKRKDSHFQDQINPATPKAVGLSGAGVRMGSRTTVDQVGNIQRDAVSTSLALQGDAFFQVQKRPDDPNSSDQKIYYTRNGDFAKFGVTKGGDTTFTLRNQNGGVGGFDLYGRPPAADGTFNSPEQLITAAGTVGGEKTSQLFYGITLPTVANTAAYKESGMPTFTTLGDHIAADDPTFLANSVAGGSTTIYRDSAYGLAPVDENYARLETRWVQNKDSNWELYGRTDDEGTWSRISSTAADGMFTFSSSGVCDQAAPIDPTKPNSQKVVKASIPSLTINGATLTNVPLTMAVSELYTPDGQTSAASLSQVGGYKQGEFDNFYADGDTVYARYTSGKEFAYRVPSVQFADSNGLIPKDGGIYEATGDVLASKRISSDAEPGVSVLSSSLEGSNVDISDEFTKMIVTQQAFSASSKVMTSADEMLQNFLSAIR